MEQRIFKEEKSSSQWPTPVGTKDDDEIQILEIKSCPTVRPRHILTHQLTSIVKEVRSREAIRKSQEKIITCLKAKLNVVEDENLRKERQLNEAASIMVEQQEALTKVGEEKVKLKDELEEEKRKRITAEGKLTKLKVYMESAQGFLAEGEILPDDLDQLPVPFLEDQVEPGSSVVAKVNELSENVKSRFKKWEDEQKERKCEVDKMKEKVEFLSEFLSSNNPQRISTLVRMNEEEDSDESSNVPRYQTRRQRAKSLERKIIIANNQSDGIKHYRDITKRLQGYQCVCDLKFASRKELDSHIQQFGSIYKECEDENEGLQTRKVKTEKKVVEVHGTHPSKPRQCLCGLISASHSALQKHIMRQRRGKRFSCKICGKLQWDIRRLRNHYKIMHKRQHNLVRTGCYKCGVVFHSKSGLFRHQKKAHPQL